MLTMQHNSQCTLLMLKAFSHYAAVNVVFPSLVSIFMSDPGLGRAVLVQCHQEC